MMKKLCGIAAALMAIGFVLLLIGGLMGGLRSGILHFGRHGFRWGQENSGDLQNLTLSGNDLSFHTLDVDISLGDITVEEGSNFSVEVKWTGDENDYTAEAKDGVLSVLCTRNFHHLASDSDAKVRITVPKGENLSAAGLHTDLGDIELERVAFHEQVELYTSLGDVDTEDCVFHGGLDAHTALGSLELDGSFLCDVNASSDLGDVEISTTEAQNIYTCHAQTDLGDISVGGRHVGNDEYESGSGHCRLDVSTDLGSISLGFDR